MPIKKLVSPRTKGINVSNERVEADKINEIIDNLNTANSVIPKECVIFLE